MDEVGFDGVTVREAIAARVLQGIQRIVEAQKAGQMSFDHALITMDILVEVTLPFVDPGSKDLVRQIHAAYRREAEARREVDRDLALAEGRLPGEFGAWGGGTGGA